jgi:hypothetical protein
MYYNELRTLPTAFRTDVHTQNIKCSESFLRRRKVLGVACFYTFSHVLKFMNIQ